MSGDGLGELAVFSDSKSSAGLPTVSAASRRPTLDWTGIHFEGLRWGQKVRTVRADALNEGGSENVGLLDWAVGKLGRVAWLGGDISGREGFSRLSRRSQRPRRP